MLLSFVRPAAWLAFPVLAVAAVAVPAQADDPPKKTVPALPIIPREVIRPADDGKPGAAVQLDQQIIADIKSRSEIMANLQHLSDVIGPRLTGSRNLERANRWAAERMKEYGLENVKLEPWEIPVGWERGPASMRLVEPDNGRTITFASSAWSPGTKGKVVAPVVVVKARTKAELDAYKGKLKGAVVLTSAPREMQPITDLSYLGSRPNAPLDKNPSPARGPFPRPRGEEPKGDAKKDEAKKDTAKAGEPKKDAAQPPAGDDRQAGGDRRPGGFGPPTGSGMSAEFLKAEGVVAVLSPSSKPHGLVTTGGRWRGSDRGEPQDAVCRLTLAYEHYGLLYRLASKGDGVKVELEVNNKFIPGPITVYNTVGEIKGSEKPDEFVVIGAHLDSWDLGTGTTDNGTGSSVILEAARVLGKLAKEGVRPKRTIRFVLYTGEEQGLYGSQEYVKRHEKEMPKTSVGLVHDTGTGKVLGFSLMGRAAVRTVLEPELASLTPLGFQGLSLRSSGGSDHQSFEAKGVPGFACAQEVDEYRLTHHTQTDTFDKAKEPNLVQGAQVMAVTAMRIANLDDLLPRDKPAGSGSRRRGDAPPAEGKKDAKKDEKKGDRP